MDLCILGFTHSLFLSHSLSHAVLSVRFATNLLKWMIFGKLEICFTMNVEHLLLPNFLYANDIIIDDEILNPNGRLSTSSCVTHKKKKVREKRRSQKSVIDMKCFSSMNPIIHMN